MATFGASYAQVAITGGVDFTFAKNASSPTDGSAAKGLAATDAYIDIGVTEDLGGGMKAVANMEFNADGAWGAGAYAGDKNVTISTASGLSVTAASTRSGGILNAIMFAPEVNGNDHWGTAAVAAAAAVAASTYSFGSAATSYVPAIGGGGVMTRAGVDALVISMPVATGLKVAYKYVEGKSDGYGTPAAVTHVLGGYYAAGPLSVQGEYNYAVADTITSGKDLRTVRYDATVSYDAGVVKVAAGYESAGMFTANSASTGTAAGAILLSAVAPVGAHSIGFNYGKRDVATFQEFAAQYNLSKSTYVAASYGSYTNAAVADGSSTVTTDSFGVRLGKNF